MATREDEWFNASKETVTKHDCMNKFSVTTLFIRLKGPERTVFKSITEMQITPDKINN